MYFTVDENNSSFSREEMGWSILLFYVIQENNPNCPKRLEHA